MENAWKTPFVVLKFPNANDEEPVLAKLLQAMGKPRKKFSGHWTLPTLRRNLGKSCEFGAEIEAMKGSYGQVKSEYLWPWHAIALFKAAMCKYHCNIFRKGSSNASRRSCKTMSPVLFPSCSHL